MSVLAGAVRAAGHAWRAQTDRDGGARGRLLLALLALALGVGLAFAIHLINRAALGEFTSGLRAVAGGADLSVRGGRQGFAPEFYAAIARLDGVAAASPMVELEVRAIDAGRSFTVVGVDLFRVGAVQPSLIGIAGAGDDLAMLRPDHIFLAEPLVAALGVAPGAALAVQSGVARRELVVGGTLPADIRRPVLAVMDIAGAQALAGDRVELTRVDVRVRPGASPEAMRERIAAIAPPGVVVEALADAGSAEARLTRSYRVNLTVLALVALFTGSLLVYSTESLAVVRRRSQLALLRALGMRRAALVHRLVGEAALLGALGGALGLLLGFALASVALGHLGADLGAGFFRGMRPQVPIDPLGALGFLLLGIAAAVCGALAPALEAARAAPAPALKAGDVEDAFARRVRCVPGLASIAAGALLTLAPPIDELPIAGYVAIAALLVGTILLMPAVASRVFAMLPGRGPPAARLALAQLRGAPAQWAVSLAAIVAAVSLATAMAIMVSSFRGSLDAWLVKLLPAEIYLRSGAGSDAAFLDAATQAAIAATPGVARAEFLRATQVSLDAGRPRVELLAREIDPADPGARLPLVREGAVSLADRARGEIPVWISEAVAEIYRLAVGDALAMPLAGRAVPTRVVGIWRDYGRQQGTLVIERRHYLEITGDARTSDAAIWLVDGADLGAVRERLKSLGAGIEIATPGEIRRLSLRVFDRTFAVTYALEAVAIVIGLAGLAASFAAIVLARRREFGVLRHLGLRRAAVARMLAAQGFLVSSLAVAVGVAAGWVISLVLIHVVNRQSFHWGMDLYAPWLELALFSIALVATAVLTALAAARRALGADVVAAVKDDW